MIRVNLSDGMTSSFDLEDEEQSARWRSLQSDRAFQSLISGVQISSLTRHVVDEDGVERTEKEKHVATIPRPKGMRSVSWEAFLGIVDGEVRREVVRCYADGVSITLTAYRGGHRSISHRVDVSRFGRRVLFPPGHPSGGSDKMSRGS